MRDTWKMTGILEEERTIEEEFILTSEDAGQVPETVTRGGTTYRLNEGSIDIQVTKKELWKDQAVLEEYVSYAVEDNDIERLQKEITKDGRTLKLIGVEYHVTETTQSGLPLAYEAVCRYAVNVDRDREVPIQWKATASYTGTVEEAAEEETAQEEETLQGEEQQERGEAGPEGSPGLPAGEIAEAETSEETKTSGEPGNAEEAAVSGGAEVSGEAEDSRTSESLWETETGGETETFGEETVPLAASVEKSAVPLNDAVAGFMGTVLLGAVFAYCILVRRKNQVTVYTRGGDEQGRFLGKTFARQEKGFWIIPISERLLRQSGTGTGGLVLKPSGRVLRGKARKAKIVSPAGTFYKEVQDTMDLWEDSPSGMGRPTERLRAEI